MWLVVACALKDVGGGGGGTSRDEANTCRARLAIDGCMLCQPPLPYRSRLAINGGVLRQPPSPPVVRISRSMGV